MNLAVILAAGMSKRYDPDNPKQYEYLHNLMIVEYSIKLFSSHPHIKKICLVVSKEHKKFYSMLTNKYPDIDIVFGAKERQGSVYNALSKYDKLNIEKVIIHDGARPFLSYELLDRLYSSSSDFVVPYLPIYDSIRDKSYNIKDINRNNIIRIQTPQIFNYKIILDLHEKYKGLNMTDDSSLIEKEGLPIDYILGEDLNFKITNINDYNNAKMTLNKNLVTRIGQGYDVHKFGNKIGDFNIMLGGIAIPSQYEIIAYSDGDVLLHAIADSLLGALALGDIGQYFPDNDPRYKNKESSFFIKEILTILAKHNAKIINIDATIICETPKISNFRDNIRSSLANILELNQSFISVKATTTEGLGYNGRSEGMTVIANSLINQYV